jgi:hypothetical protein
LFEVPSLLRHVAGEFIADVQVSADLGACLLFLFEDLDAAGIGQNAVGGKIDRQGGESVPNSPKSWYAFRDGVESSGQRAPLSDEKRTGAIAFGVNRHSEPFRHVLRPLKPGPRPGLRPGRTYGRRHTMPPCKRHYTRRMSRLNRHFCHHSLLEKAGRWRPALSD